MDIKEDQLQWYISFLIKSHNNKENIQLADELHQPIIKKFKKTKVNSSFRDNI